MGLPWVMNQGLQGEMVRGTRLRLWFKTVIANTWDTQSLWPMAVADITKGSPHTFLLRPEVASESFLVQIPRNPLLITIDPHRSPIFNLWFRSRDKEAKLEPEFNLYSCLSWESTRETQHRTDFWTRQDRRASRGWSQQGNQKMQEMTQARLKSRWVLANLPSCL